MSVKPGIEVLIGIGLGRGLIMMLKTPPNESRFLKTLTEMATREFGTCPNGTLIEFANEIRVESLIGVEIPWHLVILEAVALVATAFALIYLARRRIKELFRRFKATQAFARFKTRRVDNLRFFLSRFLRPLEMKIA